MDLLKREYEGILDWCSGLPTHRRIHTIGSCLEDYVDDPEELSINPYYITWIPDSDPAEMYILSGSRWMDEAGDPEPDAHRERVPKKTFLEDERNYLHDKGEKYQRLGVFEDAYGWISARVSDLIAKMNGNEMYQFTQLIHQRTNRAWSEHRLTKAQRNTLRELLKPMWASFHAQRKVEIYLESIEPTLKRLRSMWKHAVRTKDYQLMLDIEDRVKELKNHHASF